MSRRRFSNPIDTSATVTLPERWFPLKAFTAQMLYVRSPFRFNVVPAGRRSGKTERFKRKLVRRALSLKGVTHNFAPRYFAGAPTRDQAKGIFWEDLKELSRPWWSMEPSESDLTIELITGAQIVVVGLDKPQRIEGRPWDGGGIDEIADVKPKAFELHVRPALTDRNGWCDLIGVPEGRNHYYKRYNRARAEMLADPWRSDWGAFTWFTAAVQPPEEVEAARRDMDPLSFQQEYEASFVTFQGRAYYCYSDANLRALRQFYNPRAPLIVCIDFNVSPGVAVIAQNLHLPGMPIGESVQCCIGEVWIPDNSTTQAVCRRIAQDWGAHEGIVEVYGDATGGARKTSEVNNAGNDWDIVRAELRSVFGDRLDVHVPSANPSERARVNAVNTRLQTSSGARRLLVDPLHCPNLVLDFEGVALLEGGSGEIDKKHDRTRTHISDAVGYWIVYRWPLRVSGPSFTSLIGSPHT